MKSERARERPTGHRESVVVRPTWLGGWRETCAQGDTMSEEKDTLGVGMRM